MTHAIGNLEAGVRELIEEIAGHVPADPLEKFTLTDDLAEELVLELEERFGKPVPAALAPQLRSVAAIAAFLSQR